LRRKIAVLGSTGSVGIQALEVIGRHPEKFEVTALTANRNKALLLEQAIQFKPKAIMLTGEEYDNSLVENAPPGVRVDFSKEGLKAACGIGEPDTVLISVVGIAGLPALVECLERGVRVALANKEALVCGGRIVRDMLDQSGTKIYPVDSELSAVFQCLNNGFETSGIQRIYLTASGGPFKDWEKKDIYYASPEQALNHPNWNMGEKITVDSATMMNKGLEAIETRWLFDIPAEKIDILVHPQSIVHSMVEYVDGAVLAQMGVTSMKQPIQYALGYPERMNTPCGYMDFKNMRTLSFEAPNGDKFPCIRLALEALKKEGGMSVVLNAANEVAVEMFLNHRIPLGRIPELIESALERFDGARADAIQDIYSLDIEVRGFTYKAV